MLGHPQKRTYNVVMSGWEWGSDKNRLVSVIVLSVVVIGVGIALIAEGTILIGSICIAIGLAGIIHGIIGLRKRRKS